MANPTTPLGVVLGMLHRRQLNPKRKRAASGANASGSITT